MDDVKKPLPGDKKKPAPKKSYIDLNPTLNKRFPDNVSEGVSQSKADYVIRLGLGDPDKIFFYRQAVMNPERAVTNPQLRHYVAETLERCLDLIFNDPQMWTRAQTLLRRKYPNQVASRMSEAAYSSLARRAERRGVPIETVLEVYDRAIDEGEDAAHARVSSFLDGGRRDADLRPNDLLTKIRKALPQ